MMGIFGPPNIEKMKARNNVKGLIKFLSERYQWDPDLRQDAAAALVRIGDQRAVEPLIVAFKNESIVPVRAHVAWALGEIGDILAIEPLNSALKDDDLDDDVRKAAALALIKIGIADIEDYDLLDFAAFEEISTKSPERAVKVLFEQLLPILPEISYKRVHQAYNRITQGDIQWQLVTASGEQIKHSLVAHLQRMIHESKNRLKVFSVGTILWARAAYVVAVYHSQVTFPVRVWRTADGYVACVNDDFKLPDIQSKYSVNKHKTKRGKHLSVAKGKRLRVDSRGFYDSAPLFLEEEPELEQLFAAPPIIQKPTESNRDFWASASIEERRMTLVDGYLQHPDPEVRRKTLGLMKKYFTECLAGHAQILVDRLAADPDEAVRREVARIIWEYEREVNCEYAVNKLRDEVAFGSEQSLVGPVSARRALDLLAETAPSEETRSALERQIADLQ